MLPVKKENHSYTFLKRLLCTFFKYGTISVCSLFFPSLFSDLPNHLTKYIYLHETVHVSLTMVKLKSRAISRSAPFKNLR